MLTHIKRQQLQQQQQVHDALVTMALGKNAVVDANEDGLPVTVTLAGANGIGTIQLQMFYVLD
jgi:hypothetical protein